MKQNTEEWYLSRKDYIGASEVASVLRRSPWKTRESLLLDKIGWQSDLPNNVAIEHGINSEKWALGVYNYFNWSSFQDKVFVSRDLPWMRASIDGFHEGRAVEIKCPYKFSSFQKLQEKIPNYYMLQMQAQMFCAELEKIDFFVIFDSNNFFTKKVDRNEKTINEIVLECSDFWGEVKKNLKNSVWELQ